MKKWFDNNWVFIVSFGALIFPFLVIYIVYKSLGRNVFDNPDFWYNYMVYFGSVILAGVAMFQTQKSNKLSEKFDNMNSLQNYSVAKCCQDFKLRILDKNTDHLTVSAHHKHDSGAIILIEHHKDSNKVKYDEYLIELCFKDFSKAAIKSFEIVADQVACVQEPEMGGLYWDDGSNLPIPVAFIAGPAGSSAYPVWIQDDIFKIKTKIYVISGGVMSNMLTNHVPLSLIMSVKLHSVCGISTLMQYKYWLSKENEEVCIDNCECCLLKIEQEEIKNAD